MKKMKLVFLFMMVMFVCTGCENNSEVTRDLRHSGFNMDREPFNCDALIPKSDKEFEMIKYLGSNYAITTNGVIYDISFSGMFSNGKSCMRANDKLNVEAIMGETVFKAKDNKIYYFRGSNNAAAYTEVPLSDNNYSTYRFFFDDPEIVKVQSVKDSSYYVLKTNGNVYDYKIKKERDRILLLSTNAVYTAENLGSKIVDFNYAGDQSESTFVRTENKIFRNEALNRKECNDYIDVDCQYSFAEDATLTKHYDRILAYNGSTLITDYLKVFRVGGEVKEDEEEEKE